MNCRAIMDNWDVEPAVTNLEDGDEKLNDMKWANLEDSDEEMQDEARTTTNVASEKLLGKKVATAPGIYKRSRILNQCYVIGFSCYVYLSMKFNKVLYVWSPIF
ncbi:hypothetical protein Dimus_031082 [Dionaea muscipula]